MKELIMNAITWRRDSREGHIDESNVILTTQASQVNDTQVQTKTSVHGQPRSPEVFQTVHSTNPASSIPRNPAPER